MTTLETLPLSQEDSEKLAETIALFFAPHQDELPSAEKPRRISPEIADCLQIEINFLDKSNSQTQENLGVNEKCLAKLTEQMNEYLDKHSIPQDAIATFPSKQCLDELTDVISEFLIQNKIAPEIVDTLEFVINYQSATEKTNILRLNCIDGGPPHAPCPVGKKIG
jgi:hypothetical protein